MAYIPFVIVSQEVFGKIVEQATSAPFNFEGIAGTDFTVDGEIIARTYEGKYLVRRDYRDAYGSSD